MFDQSRRANCKLLCFVLNTILHFSYRLSRSFLVKVLCTSLLNISLSRFRIFKLVFNKSETREKGRNSVCFEYRLENATSKPALVFDCLYSQRLRLKMIHGERRAFSARLRSKQSRKVRLEKGGKSKFCGPVGHGKSPKVRLFPGAVSRIRIANSSLLVPITHNHADSDIMDQEAFVIKKKITAKIRLETPNYGECKGFLFLLVYVRPSVLRRSS